MGGSGRKGSCRRQKQLCVCCLGNRNKHGIVPHSTGEAEHTGFRKIYFKSLKGKVFRKWLHNTCEIYLSLGTAGRSLSYTQVNN